ncbi:MAG: rod shape-determining protein MreD [Candidatus Aminicenantes bacterium]|nr:rod shape-determining protein MreD [Candidatus Aminicenantes bacterium]
MSGVRKSILSPLIIITAIIFQMLWRGLPHFYADAFNFLSIAVILLALRHGEGIGAFCGSLAGLIQDSLTLHVFGLAGLTKTSLGFIVGLGYRKLNLASFINQVLFIFAVSAFELLLWASLANLIFSFNPPFHLGWFWLQPLTTTLVTGFVFRLINQYND